MPAGDLVVNDWEIELRATLMGGSTVYAIDRARGAIGGLFDVVVKQPETDYAHAAGAFVGDSFAAARTLTVALELGGTAVEAGDGVEVMQTTWAPSSTDLPLYFKVPGFGKRYVNGRPAGLVVDYKNADFGLIPMLASFRITDPTIYT